MKVLRVKRRIRRRLRRLTRPGPSPEQAKTSVVSWLVPLVVLGVLLGVCGFLANRLGYFDRFGAKTRPAPQAAVQTLDFDEDFDERASAANASGMAGTNGVAIKPAEPRPAPPAPLPQPPPEPPKPMSVAQMREDALAAQRALEAEIAAARRASQDLGAMAGIRLGAVLKDPPIAKESLGKDATSGQEAFCYVLFAPRLTTPFRKFDNPPLVRVTPQTRRIFQVEFSQAIERQPGWPYNPETTNLVGILSAKLKCKPFSLDRTSYPLADHTFVFPLGETTLTVGEFGGTRLKLILEHAGLKARARTESAAEQKQLLADSANAGPLVADNYPNGGLVKFERAGIRRGTPKAFCGIVFGSLPPFCATVATPASSADPDGFFIDYRKTRCRPFMSFTHGRAELGKKSGAVVAVSLYSNGPDNGLSDADYFRQIRTAVEQKFKVGPAKTEGAGDIPHLTYSVGSLEITLGPDPRGGFVLRAVHAALARHG